MKIVRGPTTEDTEVTVSLKTAFSPALGLWTMKPPRNTDEVSLTGAKQHKSFYTYLAVREVNSSKYVVH